MDKTLLKKIKNLLTLANDKGASEGEAENAMQKAHNLLAKHNLSLTDVQQNTQEMGVNVQFDKKQDMWMHRIWHHTAKLYFCQYWYQCDTKNKGLRRVVLGTEDNSEVVILMATYLCAQVIQLTKAHTRGKDRNWKTSFTQGCSQRLAGRLLEKYEEAIRPKPKPYGSEPYTGSTLPALTSLYEKHDKACEAWIKDSGLKMKTTKDRAKVRDNSAFWTGSLAAETVDLRAPEKEKVKLQ